jgi:hypothetical protein
LHKDDVRTRINLSEESEFFSEGSFRVNRLSDTAVFHAEALSLQFFTFPNRRRDETDVKNYFLALDYLNQLMRRLVRGSLTMTILAALRRRSPGGWRIFACGILGSGLTRGKQDNQSTNR